jgi:hypothetical protein
MTKREFDLETKRNHGERMFRDERDHYRRARGREQLGSGATARTVTVDRLAERAAWRQWHGDEPVLGIGSRYRAPACWRFLGRFPRLPSEQRQPIANIGSDA